VNSMNEQIFLPLPEDLVPEYAVECRKCELHKQRTRIIWGEGYSGTPLMVLLDNPGAREDKTGAAFVCGTRQTLQRLAFQAGIALEKLYITYVVKCRPLRLYNKKQARAACLSFFYEQVDKYHPKIIYCLGNVALQSLLNDEAAEVKSFRGHWHHWNGLLLTASYHPLAVRRRPNLFPYALSDWEMVAESI
jgi:uracil-DNA glycosylase family 4